MEKLQKKIEYTSGGKMIKFWFDKSTGNMVVEGDEQMEIPATEAIRIFTELNSDIEEHIYLERKKLPFYKRILC